jgi:diguanylate cyclase (GGDEF)-like protein
VSAVWLQRRLLILFSIGLYAVVFTSFVLFEKPGLGLAHFFYIPVALLALAGGARFGLLGGLLATVLYTLAIAATPRVPTGDVMTLATVIRLVTYSSCGALVGWFASEHRRHLGQLRELADRDFLTGLVNARVFDDTLAARCHEGARFLLLLGDMDDLKEINDTHGHTTGNNELRRLADALLTGTHPADEIARVGGDEFAVVTNEGVEQAADTCARLRAELEELDLRVSFGWAAFPDDAAGPVELFRKADDRLYAAKLIQRNHRVVEQLATRAPRTPLTPEPSRLPFSSSGS